jgi:hypothetical protein
MPETVLVRWVKRLKENNIDMHKLWIQCGKPKSGIINAVRLKAKYDYKLAIKNAAMEFEKLQADEVSDYLIQKDLTKFWTAWNSYRNISDMPVSVAGKSDPVDIANKFKSYFDDIYVISAVNIYAVDEYVKLRDTGAGCKADYPTFRRPRIILFYLHFSWFRENQKRKFGLHDLLSRLFLDLP